MKKTIVAASLLLAMSANLYAQDQKDGYQFTPVKELKITSIKNQNRTGTCWCFSTLSFLESELIRMGKGEQDLSEMFVVSHAYKDKADKYVRLHGYLNFAQGGSFIDPLYVWKKYGMVPEEVMKGLNYGENMHAHSEMESAAGEYLKAIIKNPNRKLTTAWKRGFDGIIDAYLGEAPETFTYEGKEYTPKSYAASLGLNMADYVELTSFTHHPYYEAFEVEVPDNWEHAKMFNLPLDELMEVTDHALKNGYTVCWDGDVSEKGFSFKNGVAINPELKKVEDYSNTDRARFEKMDEKERMEEAYKFEQPFPEVKVTPDVRQQGFESFVTTDDHLMHLTGIAKDQNGTKYYVTKNSWGTERNTFGGYLNMSESYVRAKTIYIMIHKDALPKALRSKLGIK